MRRLALPLAALLIAASSARAQEVPVRGTLLGADGAPMARAHIVVEDGPTDTTLIAETDAEGRFALQLPQPGGYGLYAMGVHHQTQEVPLVVTDEDAVELDIRLRPITVRPDSALAARAVGPFSVSGGEPEPVSLTRQPGGTYAVAVRVEADTLAYQLLGVQQAPGSRPAPVAGTAADRYDFDADGPFWDFASDYISVLDAAEDSVQIVFDPSSLPSEDAAFAFRSSSDRVERVAAVYTEVEALEKRIGQQSQTLGQALENVSQEERAGRMEAFRDSMRTFAEGIQELFKQRIRQEQDPLVRQWMLLRYFDELMAGESDSALARQALREVPPASPFWSFEAWSDVGASNLIFSIARSAGAPSQVRAYMDETIAEHPDSGVRGQFLYAAVNMAAQAGDETRKWRYYDRITAEHGYSRQAERLRRRFSNERAIQPGRPAPDFVFAALEDSVRTYTNEELRGQVYLIDFWGTWCAPCIQEMPHLQEAYETYRDQGFEILSVAFLDTEDDVQQFRENRYPMPWLHTLVPQEKDEEVRALFEVTGFPRPILVDETGTIIATNEQLRGEKLLEQVGQAVADKQ